MSGHRGLLTGLCLLLLLGARAHAQSRSAPLQWSSSETCAAPDDVEGRLSQFTQAPLGDARFRAEVAQSTEGAYQLRLRSEVHGEVGMRSLTLPSCAELQDASILLIAIALDPALQGTAPAPLQPQPAAPDRSAVRLGVGLSALLDVRSLPGPSAGGSVGAALDFRGLRVSLEARGLVPRAVSGLPAGGTASLGLWSAALGLAYRLQLARVWLGPMLQLELGALQVRATGVPEARDSSTLWAAGAAGAACELAITSHWRLALNLLGSMPFTRPQFGLRGEPARFTVPAAAFRATLGVEFWFGAVD